MKSSKNLFWIWHMMPVPSKSHKTLFWPKHVGRLYRQPLTLAEKHQNSFTELKKFVLFLGMEWLFL